AHVAVGHPKRVAIEEVAVTDRSPYLGELIDRLQVGFGRERHGVEGARAASHQAVRPDARLEQRLEHPDAAGASTPTPTDDEDEPSLLVATGRGRITAPSPPGQHGRGSPKA